MRTTARIWTTLAAVLVAGALLMTAAPAALAAPKDRTPPTAPANLHTISVTDEDIVMAWDALTDASGVVYRSALAMPPRRPLPPTCT